MTAQQTRVIQDLLVEAKRKLWLARTSGRTTPSTLAKYQERVEVLRSLLF